MKKDRDPQFEDTTETSLPLKDNRFTSEVQEIIEKGILEGDTALGAALEAGINKKLFNSWLKLCDDFRDWIEGLEALHLSRRRKNINHLIDKVEDVTDSEGNMSQYAMIKAAELNMKYLQNADKEFGSKHQKITNTTEGGEVITPESQEKIDKIKEKNQVVEEATKLANELPDS